MEFLKLHRITGLNYSGGSGKEVILVWFSFPPQKHINADNGWVFFFFSWLAAKIAFSEHFPLFYPLAPNVEIISPFSFSREMESCFFFCSWVKAWGAPCCSP